MIENHLLDFAKRGGLDGYMVKKWTTGLRLTIAMLLISLTIIPFITPPAHASIPKLDHIRVSLFIDARGTVPSVTLSAPTGLYIGVRHHQPDVWIQHQASTPLRASVDQYMIRVMETFDAVEANSLARQLHGLAGEAYVMSGKSEGRIQYRVYIGQFTTEAQALAGIDRLSKLDIIQPYELKVTGSYHWNAGTHQTEEEAINHLDVISESGLYAYLVRHTNDEGKLVYSVWLGEAANQLQLEQAKAEALLAMPSIDLQPVDGTLPYIITKRQIHTSSSQEPIAHYFFNGSAGHKLWINTDADHITVTERSNRSYRGAIELSEHRGRLAVINELPLEQYLYAVVGSEVNLTWPMDALKAQAVAARTFALAQGMKYGIAHVSDTTYEQAYYGVGSEYAAAIAAVDATAGEVIVNEDGLITAFYYSNAGGMTADTSEIWQTPLDYITPVPSPDHIAAEGLLLWNRVVLPNGLIGYVRSDFTEDTGEVNRAGYPILMSTESNVNVRPAPYVNNTTNRSVAQLQAGDRLVLFEQTLESNAFSWVQGPFTGEQLQQSIQRSSSTSLTEAVRSLHITERGPSGRVTGMTVNGQPLTVSTPDSFRGALNGLQSTRFDVEETGRYTVLGANGQKQWPEQQGQLHLLSGDDMNNVVKPTDSALFVLNGHDETRLITQEPQFRFVGFGFGHGIGLSQWGARELAQFLGYDYKEIIHYYYSGVSIVKG